MSAFDGALELAAAIARRELTAVEAAEHYLGRIEQLNRRLNACLNVESERTLEEAERVQHEIERRLDAGEELPVLAGVPVLVKDNICVRGFTAGCASKMLEGWRPPYDATAVSHMRDGLMIVLGKTNMDEFGMGASGAYSAYGATKNPWDTARAPGGSSSGSAAAVSAGLSPLALGTDTGGSVRQPAAFCGITGLRPTYGAVSRWGLIAFASSFDQIGPMAAGARDAAALYNVIRGADARDATVSKKSRPIGELRPVKGMKIAIVKELLAEGLVSKAVAAAINSVAEAFSHMGAEVREIDLPGLEQAVSAYYMISSAQASSNLARYDGVRYGHRAEGAEDIPSLMRKSRTEGFGSEVRRRILLGTYALSSGKYEEYFLAAKSAAARLKETMKSRLKWADMLLMPTAPGVAFGISEERGMRMYDDDLFTVPASLAGLPAVSFPCGEGTLPIGAQLIGREFDEQTILSAAAAYEDVRGIRRPAGFGEEE